MEDVISISSDDLSVGNNLESTSNKILSFTNVGEPLSLERHRFSNITKKMYNPAAKKQNDFGTNAKKILGLGDKDVPIFKKGTCLSVSLVFKLQRPKSHYVSNNPEKKQLKKNAPKQYHVARKDLDNMIKFVLDSLNGILYEDDAQICIINGTKIYANEDYNVGSTHVKLRAVDNDCIDLLLED